MTDSNYYYNIYEQYRNMASSLQKKVDDLRDLRDGLSCDFYDEQINVNQELDNLKEDLQDAIRNDNTWLTIASKCELYKEKESFADNYLKSAIDYMDDEISSLESEKSSAESNRDQAYSDYLTKKEEEQEAWLESLKNVF